MTTNETPTPKTNAILEHWDFDSDNCHEPLVSLARQLERELSEAKERIKELEYLIYGH